MKSIFTSLATKTKQNAGASKQSHTIHKEVHRITRCLMSGRGLARETKTRSHVIGINIKSTCLNKTCCKLLDSAAPGIITLRNQSANQIVTIAVVIVHDITFSFQGNRIIENIPSKI